jgi:stage III sporulation protein AA
MRTKDELLKIFSLKLRTILSKMRIDFDALQEIRLRINSPLMVNYENREYFVTDNADLVSNPALGIVITKNEIKETMEYISNYSLYAFEEEIRQGFITINGGHRIGITGKTIIQEDSIKGMKHISYINVRLAHQVKGCADKVIPYYK